MCGLNRVCRLVASKHICGLKRVCRLVAMANIISASGLIWKFLMIFHSFCLHLSFPEYAHIEFIFHFFRGWYGCVCSPVVLWNLGERLGDSNACLTAWLPMTSGLIRTKIRTVGGIKVCNTIAIRAQSAYKSTENVKCIFFRLKI